MVRMAAMLEDIAAVIMAGAIMGAVTAAVLSLPVLRRASSQVPPSARPRRVRPMWRHQLSMRRRASFMPRRRWSMRRQPITCAERTFLIQLLRLPEPIYPESCLDEVLLQHQNKSPESLSGEESLGGVIRRPGREHELVDRIGAGFILDIF